MWCQFSVIKFYLACGVGQSNNVTGLIWTHWTNSLRAGTYTDYLCIHKWLLAHTKLIILVIYFCNISNGKLLKY